MARPSRSQRRRAGGSRPPARPYGSRRARPDRSTRAALPEAVGRLCPSADHRPPEVAMGVGEHTFPSEIPDIRARRPRVCGVHSGASVGRMRPAWAGRPKGEADMIPASFDYAVARDVGHAIQLLGASGGEGKVLAGGQSLIPLMKFRLAQPALLIDINRVAGLSAIKENGDLRIGALVRENDLEANPIVRQRYPILVETAAVIADPLVRNLATIGGNLAHADPANDHPATMLAVRASVVAQGSKGERVIPIDDFFLDTFTTALRSDEILIELRIPKPAARSGGAYLKLERRVGDFAIVGVAAMVRLDESGKIAAASIGLTNVGLTAIRARRAEETLRGQVPDDKALAAAGAAAAAESQPVSDLRGPAEYKRDVVRVLTQRAIRKAVARAKGGN